MTKKVNISTDAGADIQSVSDAVSSRLKALRREHTLTLDELSRRSGVSKGMLVEIEKGEANPSIAILCKVAAAFGVSVADIVSVAEASAVRLIPNEAIPSLWQGPKGGSARLLAGTSGPDMIELWRWVMSPGEAYEAQGHPLGTVELLHVEKGVLSLWVNESVSMIPEGCSAIAKTDVPHRYVNDGTAELVFSMTVAELHRPRGAF
ncbi:helix-turn-helix domain-containing protein [Ralstonia pseudosolanacearum]|uniref:helix-turn-helix domain-containing protein n=1 Tax=Ralstonia pseudosolanacearum TaxID=1310165 RepID=UPI0008DA53C0|nr:helix-turn-helix domain-containing protein [Ralstonia pseudosolanacearum]MCL1622311.1 helix-turn-helix domain-containing protein [Ralstonia pseudosolanacearum CaRs-Mep]